MIAARPWGLEPGRQQEILRALRFRYFKWDTYACGTCLVLPEVLVLSRQTHEEIVGIVERLHQALTRFERRVRQDPRALGKLGIPPALHGWIAEEEDTPLQFARYDLFPTDDDRWMVSEFNEDVPGGFNEAVGLPELLGDPGDEVQWAGDLRGRFLAALDPYESVGLLYATAYSEDLQHMLILERWLSDVGHHTVLGSPAHLKRRWRRPRILGEPIDAVFRFYPGEWMPRLPNLGTWIRLGARLPMMNPLRHLVRQSKTMFALWRRDGSLDAADRTLVERHCPWTEPFDVQSTPRLRDERARWVLKRAFGRMGDSVVVGALATEREWDETLTEASRAPGEWCMQERFVVRAVRFETGPLFPALGAFVVNGRFAGYYTRAAARPLITHEAYHVATLVQAA